MTKVRTIYLAGPEVFLPALPDGEPPHPLTQKKELCERYGFQGLSPLDNGVPDLVESSLVAATYIAHDNERLIKSADLVIANLTAFRGPSADAGTVYEVGYARALGKIVYGYTNTPGSYLARVQNTYYTNLPAQWVPDVDPNQMQIEDFDQFDNLMISNALMPTGGVITVEGAPTKGYRMFMDLRGFEKCLQRAKELFE